MMFVINGKLVTAPLSDSILDGVTRDSRLPGTGTGYERGMARSRVAELEAAFKKGMITEAFWRGHRRRGCANPDHSHQRN